jgi:hypothetical protein
MTGFGDVFVQAHRRILRGTAGASKRQRFDADPRGSMQLHFPHDVFGVGLRFPAPAGAKSTPIDQGDFR